MFNRNLKLINNLLENVNSIIFFIDDSVGIKISQRRFTRYINYLMIKYQFDGYQFAVLNVRSSNVSLLDASKNIAIELKHEINIHFIS